MRSGERHARTAMTCRVQVRVPASIRNVQRRETHGSYRVYYQKIREHGARIRASFRSIVSLETPDGGKAGSRRKCRRLAAKLMVEGLARLATGDEAEELSASSESGSASG